MRDLLNTRFGRLTIERFAGIRRVGERTRSFWLCHCDCGNECEIRSDQLIGNVARSCGCLQREAAVKLARARTTPKTINLRKVRSRRTAKGLPSNLGVRDLTGRR